MQMINIGTSKLYPWGWRLSLGLCMVPATTLLLGGIFLDDTPNSLCERGHPEKVHPLLKHGAHYDFANLCERLADGVRHALLCDMSPACTGHPQQPLQARPPREGAPSRCDEPLCGC